MTFNVHLSWVAWTETMSTLLIERENVVPCLDAWHLVFRLHRHLNASIFVRFPDCNTVINSANFQYIKGTSLFYCKPQFGVINLYGRQPRWRWSFHLCLFFTHVSFFLSPFLFFFLPFLFFFLPFLFFFLPFSFSFSHFSFSFSHFSFSFSHFSSVSSSSHVNHLFATLYIGNFPHSCRLSSLEMFVFFFLFIVCLLVLLSVCLCSSIWLSFCWGFCLSIWYSISFIILVIVCHSFICPAVHLSFYISFLFRLYLCLIVSSFVFSSPTPFPNVLPFPLSTDGLVLLVSSPLSWSSVS